MVLAAPYSRQTFPWTICRSVCPVHCGKTADRIRMPFGIIGRTGPGMRQVVGYGDRSTGRGTFGANLGLAVGTNGDFTAYVCDSAATRPSSQITLGKLVYYMVSGMVLAAPYITKQQSFTSSFTQSADPCKLCCGCGHTCRGGVDVGAGSVCLHACYLVPSPRVECPATDPRDGAGARKMREWKKQE